jgi:hypothetical protein
VRGTDAHEWANGAAAGEAFVPATLVVAVAALATSMTARSAPARSQRRLTIR